VKEQSGSREEWGISSVRLGGNLTETFEGQRLSCDWGNRDPEVCFAALAALKPQDTPELPVNPGYRFTRRVPD